MVFLLLPLIIQGGSPTPTTDNMISSDSGFESTTIMDQSSSDYTTLPYLRNSTPYLTWVDSLVNNATLPDNPSEPELPLYFAQSDRSGETITDNKHYFEDAVIFLNGLASMLDYSNEEILAYFNQLKDYKFWDSESGEQGFYSYIDSQSFENSSVKALKGNAQYILSLNKLLENTATNSEATNLIQAQWTVLNDIFYDSKHYLYNHTDSDGQKYMEDQFLAALSGYLINKYNLPNAASAKTRADDVMKLLIDEHDSGNYFIFKNNAFDYKRNFDLSASSSVMDLKTNAYGILALLEWFLADELVENSNYLRVEKAEAIFNNFYHHLWSNSYSLFMNTMWKPGANIVVLDDTIDVVANSIMLLAVERLYQITGNFSYFEIAMKMFNGLEKNMRDSAYGTYYTSVNATSGQYNDIKSLKTHANIINAYNELNDFGQQSSLTLDLNQTEFIKDEANPLNVSAEYFLDFTLSSGDFTKQKIYDIFNATFSFVFRAPNGTIIESQEISGNNSGKCFVLFNFEDNMEFGEYHVSLRVNYTGISTQFASSVFNLQPGIEIVNLTLQSSKIRCGENFNVSFQIDSEKITNITADIQIEGDWINNQTIFNQLIQAETLNNYSFTVIVDQVAEFGNSNIIIKILNNSLEYAESSIEYMIYSSIEIISVQQVATVFRARNFTTIVSVENKMGFAESIIMELSGDNISPINLSLNLAAYQIETVELTSFVQLDTSLGDLSYDFQISRKSDNSEIKTYSLSSKVKNPLEFLYITPPEKAYQWRQNSIICSIQNNMDDPQGIQVYLNDQLVSSLSSVAPGENILSIPISKTLRNPYELGIKSFRIEIYDSNGLLLYQDTITTQVEPSLGSILLGYVLPLAIPIIGIVIVKHMALENKKRLM
ncbi:MAG: hypothetical protein ACTSWC_03595 [Promethearchaeota archaeon]